MVNLWVPSVEAKPSESNLYRVDINDVIEINVVDHPDIRTVAPVSVDGTITFPYIGEIYVKGKTITEIRKELESRLSDGYLKFPVVSVSATKAMTKKIIVFGEVRNPGEVPYEKGITVVKTLSKVGGINEKSLYGKVKIRRKQDSGRGNKNIEIDMRDIRESSEKVDILLTPDDILIVEGSKTIFVQGYVTRPGQYILEDAMTIGRVITIAGGIAEGGIHGKIKIRRHRDGVKNQLGDFIAESKVSNGIIRDKRVEDMRLQPDDIVVIEKNETFFIQGEVMKPGVFILEDGMTVGRAITIAGGIKDHGLHGKVIVRRRVESQDSNYKNKESGLNNGIIKNKEVEDLPINPDDIIVVERDKTFFLQGEVEKPGQYVLEDALTVSKAITMAGGIKEGGRFGKVKVRRKRENVSGFDDIEIDLKGVIEGSIREDMLLWPDDILIVERNKTIIVYGEVSRIGEYSYEDGMTVFKAIVLAGGFTKWGSPGKVKILRPLAGSNGFTTVKVNINDVIDGQANANIVLQPGDIIIISAGIL